MVAQVKRNLLRHRIIVLVMIGTIATVGLISGLMSSTQASTTATVTTDKHLYHPGDVMTITGAGFLPSSPITVTVKRADQQTDLVPGVQSDTTGSFTATYTIPGVNGSYRITATDGTNTATTSAADPTVSPNLTDYSQWANDKGATCGTGTNCQWINGNLNPSNSAYQEGDATVQRAFLTQVTPTADHTITFQYDTTKAGSHAYDFLTSDDFSEGYIEPNRVCESASKEGFPDCLSVTPNPSATITDDPNTAVDNLYPNNRTFKIRNGTITAISTPTIVAGNYSSDSDTAITLTFHAPTNCTDPTTKAGVTTCPVLITFGAHVSQKSDYPSGTTASAISGSPYHVALVDIDGSAIGQRDNQMSTTLSGATLTLHKVVVNDNGGTAAATDWTLTATGPTNLSGVDGNTSVTAVPVAPGTFTLGESGGPSGYNASQYSCVVNGGNPVSGNSVTLKSGDTAVCTITNNDAPPQLHLIKTVTNDNGGTAAATAWTLTATGTGGSPTNLSGTTPVNSSTTTFKADTYTLAENGGPTGYTAGNWSCVLTGTQTAVTVTNSQVVIGLGQDITCTINNNDNPATIIIQKNALPATGTFNFTATTSDGSNPTLPLLGGVTQSFSLTGSTSGGGNVFSQQVDAGTYTVIEGSQSGWILTGVGSLGSSTCTVSGSGGSTGTGNVSTATASITAKAGDTITCIFENTGTLVTRTQGFWATHPDLAHAAWFGGTADGHTFQGVTAVLGNQTLDPCNRAITTDGQLMGAFWSNIANRTVNPKKRSSLDQSRMQLLQQLIAAELNASAFSALPPGGIAQINGWEAAYCGTDQSVIQTAIGEAGSFNTSGDNGLFTPGVSADAKAAKAIADLAAWDNLP